MVCLSFCTVLLGLSCTYGVLAVNPVVELDYSTFHGVANDSITSWKGIPFAAPPVGGLRFARPQAPPAKSGIQDASKQGPLCISTPNKFNTTVPDSQSEDCLYLTVYAPSSANSTSNLPVFVFIQGGGFNSNANPNLNGTGLIEASGNEIITVLFNYRVGPWGFLTSNASEQGSPQANNGLHDQRAALQWVQKYISNFGGDPNHVTIGGDSAGAASVSLHLTAYGGRNDNLFAAAAAESVSFATVLTTAQSQYQYTHFAGAAGCGTDPTAQSLACLRNKTANELQAINVNIPYPFPPPNGQAKAPLYEFNPAIDGDIITDLTYNSFAKGQFVRVPIIFGDDTNGGTVFTPKNTTTQQESNAFLTQQFPFLTTSDLTTIADLYPNANQSACPAVGCYWRQVSDAYGQGRYMCPGLYISSAYSNVSTTSSMYVGGGSARQRNWAPWGSPASGVKSWAYRYNVEDPTQFAQGYGVPHTVELNALFGPDNVPYGSAPASYYPGQLNAPVVPVIQAYWTSFIKHYDPNVEKYPGSAEWTQYLANGEPQRLLFETGGSTVMEAVDQLTRERCAFWNSIGPSILQK